MILAWASSFKIIIILSETLTFISTFLMKMLRVLSFFAGVASWIRLYLFGQKHVQDTNLKLEEK